MQPHLLNVHSEVSGDLHCKREMPLNIYVCDFVLRCSSNLQKHQTLGCIIPITPVLLLSINLSPICLFLYISLCIFISLYFLHLGFPPTPLPESTNQNSAQRPSCSQSGAGVWAGSRQWWGQTWEVTEAEVSSSSSALRPPWCVDVCV